MAECDFREVSVVRAKKKYSGMTVKLQIIITKELLDIALRSKDSLISRRTKWNVSAHEECSWCSFGLGNNTDLKIIYRENSASCKQ